jgi:NitT/TauT family transport system ATP-binding protein
MVFVTHSIDEAVLFGDRVAVLRGRPSSVLEVVPIDLPKPRDRAVSRSAAFLDLREYIWGLVMGNDTGLTASAPAEHLSTALHVPATRGSDA